MKNSYVKLKDVAKLEWGNTSITKSSYVEVGFPAFSAAGSDGYLKHAEFEEDGIVLSAIGARCGKCFKAHGKWTAIKNTITIIPNKEQVDLNYLFTQLNDEKSWKISGAAQPFITLATVRDRLIQLPPLAEQQRIAALLDTADRILKQRELAIAKLDQLAQSVFVDMFLNGDWSSKCLKQLGKVKTGGTPSSDKSGMFGAEIPFITPGDLQSNLQPKRFLSLEGATQSVVVKKGSALVCCIGATIGKMDKAKTDSAFNQQLNAVEWSDEINEDYGIFALHNIKNKIVNGGSATTLPIIKKSLFEKLEIKVPPINLQNKFSQHISKIEEQKKLYEIQLHIVIAMTSSLQHQSFAVN